MIRVLLVSLSPYIKAPISKNKIQKEPGMERSHQAANEIQS